MTCRSTPLSSGVTSYARLVLGLEDQQTLSLVHELRREAGPTPPPTRQEVNSFIDQQIAAVRDDNRLSVARRRDIIARLERARTQDIDGPTWYAVTRVFQRAQRAQNALRDYYDGLARDLGVSRQEVETQIASLRGQARREGRQAAAPRQWLREFAARPENSNLPLDRQTAYAIYQLEARRREALARAETRPTILNREPVNSSVIRTLGYDPDSQRLEVELHTRPGRPYAYRVPPHIVRMLRTAPSIGAFYNRHIRGNSRYQYQNEEEHNAAGVQRRCATCGQWADPSHTCPVPETREQQPTPTPVTASAAPAPEPAQTGSESNQRTGVEPVQFDASAHSYRGGSSHFYAPNLSSVRVAAHQHGAVAINVSSLVHRVRDDNSPTGWRESSGHVTGQAAVTYSRETGCYEASNRSLRCSCAEYLARYDCPHVRQIVDDVTTRINQQSLRERHNVEAVQAADRARMLATANPSSTPASAEPDREAAVTPADGERDRPACDCDAYRRNGDCPHVRPFVAHLDALVNGNPPGRTQPAEQGTTPTTPGQEAATQSAEQDIISGQQPNEEPVQFTASLRRYHGDTGNFRVPNLSAVRQAARQHGAVTIPVSATLVRLDDGTPGGRPIFNHNLNGFATVRYRGRGQGYEVTEASGRRALCWCAEYERNGTCRHVRQVLADLSTRINQRRLRDQHRISSATQTVSAVLARERVASIDAQTAAQQSWGPAEVSYRDNMDAFQRAYNAAKERFRRGEPPVPYLTENATDGLGARGTGRGFGVEIEFEIESGDTSAALAAIGRDLYEAGLTSSRYQERYGTSRGRGYTDSHRGGWSFERDGSLRSGGEIVSPIMYDEPETWENLARVCEIVRRHGGQATMRAGSHVHVSVGDFDHDVDNYNRLFEMFKEYEDDIYRLSTNPGRGIHRGLVYCRPNTVPAGGYISVSSARISNSNHQIALNLQSVHGRSRDHIEFRTFDSSLDTAVIQTQIKMALGLTQAAFRERNYTPGRRNRLGSHYDHNWRTYGLRRLTGEAWRQNTATFRSFADLLFRREVDKSQLASLFAVTRWQRER